MNWRKMLIWIITIPIGVLVLLLAYLYYNQDRIIFQPSSKISMTPDEIGLAYEDIRLEVEPGISLHGWFFQNNSSASAPTVLFCNGNAGNISDRIETARFLLTLGANVMLFDYRGYGESTGSPSEAGVYKDARAIYNWLLSHNQTDPADIVIFGRSLGGAIAVELANHVKCRGLIVESAFTSIEAMAEISYPLLPVKMLVRHKLASIEKVGQLTCPVLVMHSPDDQIVPFEMGQQLHEGLRTIKRFYQLEGGHNELAYYNDPEYVANVRDLLAGRLGEPE